MALGCCLVDNIGKNYMKEGVKGGGVNNTRYSY